MKPYRQIIGEEFSTGRVHLAAGTVTYRYDRARVLLDRPIRRFQWYFSVRILGRWFRVSWS